MTAIDRKLQFQTFEELEQGGLYSQEALEDARRQMLFPIQVQKVVQILVDRVTRGVSSKEPDFELLLSPDHFKRAAMTTLKSLWGNFQALGNIFSGFLGLYYIILAIKLLFSALLSFKQLHAVFGRTWKLLTCFCPIFAKYLITTKHSKDIKHLFC